MRKLYIDVDNTLINSVAASVHVWNKYHQPPSKKPVDYRKVYKWDMTDVCKGINQSIVVDIFESDEFFKVAQPHKDVLPTLRLLQKEGYEIIAHSIGTTNNLIKKMAYLERAFGKLLSGYIMINNGFECTMNKSILNFADGVIVDDHVKNLTSSNAPIRICAKMNKGEWNSVWSGLYIDTFKELPTILKQIEN